MDLGGCELDLLGRVFTGPAGSARLSEAECALLAYLAARPGEAVGRHELLREVWGYAPSVRSRTVDTTLNRLRNKLEVDPKRPALLISRRGRGIAFHPPRPAAEPGRALLGRDRELARIEAELGARETGLITLVGPPGVGKTRLATEIAGRLEAPLVEARAARSAADLGASVLRTLGPKARGGPFAAVDLLVLDNLEQLDEGGRSQVRSWAAQGRVLATSQRPLGGPSERIESVEPLGVDDAVALVATLLPAGGPPEPAELRQLVASCDRLPLELEILATSLPRFGVSTLSEVSALNLPARQGAWSLAEALDWSWSLLDAEAARVLRWLSVFHGSFDLQAAAAVLEVPPFALLGTVSELHDRSLVTGERGVFRLLGVVRDAARQRLMAAGEAERAHDGLARWCTALWEDYVRRGPARMQRHHLDALAILRGLEGPKLGPLVAVLVEATPVPTWMELEVLLAKASASRGAEAGFLWAAYRDAARMAGDPDAVARSRKALGALQLEDGTSLGQAWVLGRSDAMVEAFGTAPDHERGYFVQRLPREARDDRLKELLQTARARGWVYAEESIRALLGMVAFEAGDPDASVALLGALRGEHLASFRDFYLGMARLDLGAVSAAREDFDRGRTLAPAAYAARCAVLLLVVDLAEGREEAVREALSDPVLERFNVGELTALVRALVEQRPDPRWEPTLTAWRSGELQAPDRSSFVAWAARWLLARRAP